MKGITDNSGNKIFIFFLVEEFFSFVVENIQLLVYTVKVVNH